jgi:uncharacterized repeat protein (TIGR04052 family)
VQVQFRPVDADAQDVRCGMTNGKIAGLTDVRLGDLRLYVHDVRLLKGDREVALDLTQDGAWQKDGTALLDFEDRSAECALAVFGKATTPETNRVVRGVPREAGPYTGVAFRVGVPFSQNYLPLATAPSPLNLSGMDHESDGRQFLRVVLYSPSTNNPDAGTMFQGAHNLVMLRSVCDSVTSGDAGAPPTNPAMCAKSNRAEVRMTGAFDPASSSVLFNVDALLKGYPTPGAANIGSPKLSSAGRIDCFGPLHARDLGPNLGAERCGTFYPNLGLNYASGATDGPQTTFVLRP